MSTITVLLAEDHQIVREGLRAMLNLETDMKVIGEAENGRQAVEFVTRMRPDVVVMDIAMPLLNGMEATRQILHTFPDTRVLVLSAHSDDAYVAMVMAIGASGYLIKQTAAHVLPEAIRAVHQGNNYFSPIIAKRRHYQKQKDRNDGELPGKALPTLSAREMEVLQLIAEGKANKESANELHISVKTVEKHRQSLMDKLNIHDTASLTRYAISMGIIENSVQPTIV